MKEQKENQGFLVIWPDGNSDIIVNDTKQQKFRKNREEQARHRISFVSTQGDVDAVGGIEIPNNCDWVAFDEYRDWPIGLVKYDFDEVNKILYVRRRMMC